MSWEIEMSVAQREWADGPMLVETHAEMAQVLSGILAAISLAASQDDIYLSVRPQ